MSLKASRVLKGKENTTDLAAQEENFRFSNSNRGMLITVAN